MSPKYLVNSTLSHNMTEYAQGDTVRMSEDEAGILQPLGVIGDEVPDLTDEEIVEKIKVAANLEEIVSLAGKIKRKAIVEAVAARKLELAL
jgi:hypothetical protein